VDKVSAVLILALVAEFVDGYRTGKEGIQYARQAVSCFKSE
jgi:hypothetical protein